MVEQSAEIKILLKTKKGIEDMGVSFEKWFSDQVALAEAMNRGEIFQKVGEEFLKLNIGDIPPFNESSGEIRNGAKFETFVVPRKEVEEIVGENEDLKKWARRVINLGMMAPNLDLYFWDGEEYSKLAYSADEGSENG